MTLNEQNQQLLSKQTDSDMNLLKSRLQDLQSQFQVSAEYQKDSHYALEKTNTHYQEMQIMSLSLTTQLAECKREKEKALDAQIGKNHKF